MIKDLREVKRLRRALGLTQKELAKVAGISQSYLAKIELGKANPNYSTAMKVIEALQKAQESKIKDRTAEEVMTTGLIYVSPADTLRDAIVRMHENFISQLPVMDGDVVVGSISESTVVRAVANGKDLHKLYQIRVEEVMDPPFPIVDATTQVNVVASLLLFYNAVLVGKKGKVIGIITRSDILKG